MWTAIATVATLALSILAMFRAANDTETKAINDAKQKISDAVASGDVSRINNVIGGLRR